MPRTTGSTTRQRRVGDARQRAWNMIRLFKRFTSEQIAPPAEISVVNLRKYLKALACTGYLALARPKQNGKVSGHAIWQLVRNSGPRSPLVRRDGGGVYDPNHDQLYPYLEPEPTQEPAHDPATPVPHPVVPEAPADVRKLA